jgi:thiamine biosynthesis lipoprotein
MGSTARVVLESDTHDADALERHAGAIRTGLDDVERALTRFSPHSELSALNRDPRAAVPASPLLRRLASLQDALPAAPPRRAARPHPARAHAHVTADDFGRVVRPPGVGLDPGGLGKGLAADLAALTLPEGVRFAISCGGDLALGGSAARPWDVSVESAHTRAVVHRLRVRAGGVATSGVSSRLWRRPDGTYAHHLLDPATGEPAWTGLVAVTAVAASALDAEILAKTAVLAGRARARRLVARRGGVLQHDDGRVEVVAGPLTVRLPRPALTAAA